MAKAYLNSPAKGVLMGVSATGGWLLADLLLPEPWGDYVLYAAMAVVNIAVGWKLGKLYGKQEEADAVGALYPNNAAKSELQP